MADPPARTRYAAPGRTAARRAERQRRRLRGWRILGGLAALVLLAGGGTVAYVYEQLSGNIRTDDLSAGSTGKERRDAFGRSPVNLLVIGSDARTDPADCRLGGDCGTSGGSRADVEMVLHISADRSNATVMSIPRDLVTTLPACADPRTGRDVPERVNMINSALDYGPDCQVSAVHHLTGIPIDHFVEVDFAGVVSMSDAVGGVDVCVDDDVYDPLSHLKLKKGGHTLKGVAALEFLRTRHGFGDGSDNVGRTGGQHYFLAALFARLKGGGILHDATAALPLAEAATKALTVDTGLGSVGRLVDLAQEFGKVPGDRITFTTMQNVQDPADHARVVAGPGAATLFRAVAADEPLTTPPGRHPAPAAAPVGPADVAVTVLNGTGLPGRAAAVLAALTGAGFSPASTSGNAPAPATTTTLTYPAGHADRAHAVAAALGLPAASLRQGTAPALVLTLGADWPTGTVYPGGHPTTPPADPRRALNGAMEHNGATNGCVPVSTALTIPTPTGGITPHQSYATHPDIPDSAP